LHFCSFGTVFIASDFKQYLNISFNSKQSYDLCNQITVVPIKII
jgi:hypothetical protein